MDRLTINDVARLFDDARQVAVISGDRDAIARTANYCASIDAIKTWPQIAVDLVEAVNRYRQTVQAISTYLVYATRFKAGADPILDTLVDAGRREQEIMVAAFRRRLSNDELNACRREIVDILSSEVCRPRLIAG